MLVLLAGCRTTSPTIEIPPLALTRSERPVLEGKYSDMVLQLIEYSYELEEYSLRLEQYISDINRILNDN